MLFEIVKRISQTNEVLNDSTQNTTALLRQTDSGSNGHKSMQKIAAQKASRNITLMVVWTCFLYVFGTAPYTLAYISSYLMEYNQNLYSYTIFSLGMLFLAHGVNFFVYFSFNTIFRSVFFGYFKFFINFITPNSNCRDM